MFFVSLLYLLFVSNYSSEQNDIIYYEKKARLTKVYTTPNPEGGKVKLLTQLTLYPDNQFHLFFRKKYVDNRGQQLKERVYQGNWRSNGDTLFLTSEYTNNEELYNFNYFFINGKENIISLIPSPKWRQFKLKKVRKFRY